MYYVTGGVVYGGVPLRRFYPTPIKVVHQRKMHPPQRHQRQYRKDRSIPVTIQTEEKRTWQVVAAIDFGTAYSGFAFSMKDSQLDVIPGKWKTHSSDLLESPKTPTSLLLTISNDFVAFGYEAEKQFRELVEEDKHNDYRYFNQMKMVLFQDKRDETAVEVMDHMNRPMKALDVFSLAIKYLYDQCLETLLDKNVKKEGIRWVVTVPAIWDEFAKQFMRNAAEKAGIPRSQLTLALEPEAAAIYSIKGSRTDLTSKSINKYSRGSQILIVDLGGGTADFSLIGISGDKKLEVLHKASGGALGGNTINTKVWEILEELLGKNVIEEFKKQTSDFMEMESNIELKKRDLSSESKLQLTMFPSLSETCKSLTGKTYRELVGESHYAQLVKVRTGKIIFEHEMINKMFERTLEESFNIMDKLLKIGTNIKDIVLVGGFSDSEIIQKQFKERFMDYEVIIPADAGLAVLKGAVIFGHDEKLIKSRICPFTYGVEVLRFWLASDPEGRKKIINGTSYFTGTFDKLVTIEDTVEVGKTVEREFFAPSNSDKNLKLRFYRTDKRDVQSVNDEGCVCIGKLKINLLDPLDGTEHAVHLSLKFGETEITVRGIDKTTGQLVNTTIDFQGKVT
ncbi:heat shock 70 kDa protein 12A-like [Saccostrea cucullata]|uniref:heat shock 70 kDa protein 12A-like n=1 Tax=Saccostrea cuccullata TaxID=36930 RepID=UPI002ED50285